MKETVPIRTPCGVIEMPLDGTPVDSQGRVLDPLAVKVAARWLRANDELVAEPGTTYVYQVDRNNQVLYPGERVLVTVGDKLLRGEVVLGDKMVPQDGGPTAPSLAVRCEDGNIYDAVSQSVTKVPQTIPTQRTVEALEIPQVIEEVRMQPHTYLVCPHCRQDIHEKAIHYDGSNFFHSVASCRTKPVRMPPPKPEALAFLKQLGLRG